MKDILVKLLKRNDCSCFKGIDGYWYAYDLGSVKWDRLSDETRNYGADGKIWYVWKLNFFGQKTKGYFEATTEKLQSLKGAEV